MNMRDFWAAEAAKMRDTSHLGIDRKIVNSEALDTQAYEPSEPGESSYLRKLTQSLQQFANQFADAKKQTKADRVECGFVIYHGSDNKLYLSDRVTGDTQTAMIATWHEELNAPSARGARNVTLTLAGIYHTHPDNGTDQNPLSNGDIITFFDTVAAKTFYNQWKVKTGFFMIADDTNGGRYAAVIENLDVATRTVTNTKNKYNTGFEARVGGASNLISGTAGKKTRDYYRAILKPQTGIGSYYGENNNSVNLNRL